MRGEVRRGARPPSSRKRAAAPGITPRELLRGAMIEAEQTTPPLRGHVRADFARLLLTRPDSRLPTYFRRWQRRSFEYGRGVACSTAAPISTHSRRADALDAGRSASSPTASSRATTARRAYSRRASTPGRSSAPTSCCGGNAASAPSPTCAPAQEEGLQRGAGGVARVLRAREPASARRRLLAEAFSTFARSAPDPARRGRRAWLHAASPSF